MIINEKWLFSVSINELGYGPSEVAFALQEGHLDLISHICKHGLPSNRFFLSEVLYLLCLLILKFNQRFVETLLYLSKLTIFGEILLLLLFNDFFGDPVLDVFVPRSRSNGRSETFLYLDCLR